MLFTHTIAKRVNKLWVYVYKYERKIEGIGLFFKKKFIFKSIIISKSLNTRLKVPLLFLKQILNKYDVEKMRVKRRKKTFFNIFCEQERTQYLKQYDYMQHTYTIHICVYL